LGYKSVGSIICCPHCGLKHFLFIIKLRPRLQEEELEKEVREGKSAYCSKCKKEVPTTHVRVGKTKEGIILFSYCAICGTETSDYIGI